MQGVTRSPAVKVAPEQVVAATSTAVKPPDRMTPCAPGPAQTDVHAYTRVCETLLSSLWTGRPPAQQALLRQAVRRLQAQKPETAGGWRLYARAESPPRWE